MKKLAAVVMVAALLVGGCAGFGQWSTGAQKVVDFICKPTEAQKATAAQMLAALDAAQAVGSAFYPALGIAKASAVLTNIKNGGCFLVAELAEAFKAVDAANTALAKAQLKKMPDMAPPALPEYPDLRVFVK